MKTPNPLEGKYMEKKKKKKKKKVFSVTWTMPHHFTVYLEAEDKHQAYNLFWIQKAYTWKTAKGEVEKWNDYVHYSYTIGIRVEEDESGHPPSLPITW
jgi:type I restriction-modification system DNA methylase subunit